MSVIVAVESVKLCYFITKSIDRRAEFEILPAFLSKKRFGMGENMIIDFTNMEETVMPEFKGGEKEMRAKMYVDESNRIMRCRLIPGASVGLHTHEGNSEIVFILEGNGKAVYDGAEERISAGMCHYCPKGHSHTIVNDTDTDLIFYAVVPQQ